MNGPDPVPVTVPARPYPGVESYRYADREIFFARELDAKKLAAHVTIYRSVLLYGVSGTGKSSLINAAVIPLVIKDGFAPERIRVQPRPGEEIVIERIPATRESGPPYLPSVFARSGETASRIVLSADGFRARLDALPEDAYPLLIFDQFEEFVSLFEEASRGEALRPARLAQDRVRDLLIDLARDTLRRVKLLFVFREDYLAKLGELFALIPDLRNRYVRLAPPPPEALHGIIRGPFLAFPGHFSPELSETLATALATEFATRTEAGGLNLSEVQIACARLWSAANPAKEFNDRGLQGLLEDSLSEALGRLPDDLRDPAVALLGRMVTDAGLRNVISRDDLLARAHEEEGFRLDRLERSLEALVTDTRLVRKERRRDVLFFEIISEFLVPWIGRQRILRQIARQRRRTRAIIAGVSLAAAIGAIAVVRSLSSQLKTTSTELATTRRELVTARGEEISFLGGVEDPDTAMADGRLKRFLERAVAEGSTSQSNLQTVFQQQIMPDAEVIRAVAEPDPGRGYVARIRPFAYVAAEMLGAKLTILAVYQSSATGLTTYHSYFVARKDRFTDKTRWQPERGEPSLQDVERYLRSFAQSPAKFMYHDLFSASSYFLPSLYFKSHDVFAMSRSLNPRLIPIEVVRLASTSTAELVPQVLEGKADLVAVSDITRKKFESHPNLVFVQIPTALPNDFLVAAGVGERTTRLIVDAIRIDPAAGRWCTDLADPPDSSTGAARRGRARCVDAKDARDKTRPADDFDAWYVWDGNDSELTDEAKAALATLRQEARQQTPPVVVKVEGKRTRGDNVMLDAYVDAAKEAVRLSGTEFVLEDRDLHRRVDMTWTLESIHDGALQLTSRLDSAFRQSEETFTISFADSRDLPRRLADLARSRMRRIRYVWPYEQKYPVVLRDLDFTPDERVQVQKIAWLDPARNEYEEDTPFSARIENGTDFSKLRISDEIRFPRIPDGSFNFDPMSNTAYRVVIDPAANPGRIWVVLPYCFIALLGLACAGLLVDLRRRESETNAVATPGGWVRRILARARWRKDTRRSGA